MRHDTVNKGCQWKKLTQMWKVPIPKRYITPIVIPCAKVGNLDNYVQCCNMAPHIWFKHQSIKTLLLYASINQVKCGAFLFTIVAVTAAFSTYSFQLLWQFHPSTLHSQAGSCDLWATATTPDYKCYSHSVQRLAVYMEIEHWSVFPQREWVYGVVWKCCMDSVFYFQHPTPRWWQPSAKCGNSQLILVSFFVGGWT